MGDRANVFVKEPLSTDPTEGVFLYTHWRGWDLAPTVRDALAKQERWDDSQYLARILFQELLDGDCGTTGFGISAKMHDNERPVLVIDTKAATISVATKAMEVERTMPIAEFVKLDDDSARTWHLGPRDE